MGVGDGQREVAGRDRVTRAEHGLACGGDYTR